MLPLLPLFKHLLHSQGDSIFIQMDEKRSRTPPRSPKANGATPLSALSEPGSPKQQLGHLNLLSDLSDAEIIEYETFVTNALVAHPKKVMACCTVAFILLTIISFGVIGFKITETQFEDKYDSRTKKMEAANNLREEAIPDQPVGRVSDVHEAAPSQLLRSNVLSSFAFVYDGRGDNVLTVENVRFIKETEDRLFNHEHYAKFCVLGWREEGSACPGADCSHYRDSWDYTFGARFVDNATAVCELPLQSISWWIYNARVVNKDATPCNVETDFAHCVATGLLMLSTEVNDGSTAAEKRAVMNNGGREPTQTELDAFAQMAFRLRTELPATYGFFKYFFDKDFGHGTWESEYIRSTLYFGGPMETYDPSDDDAGTVCYTRSTEADCVSTVHCEWVPYAGMDKGFVNNVTGCAVKQDSAISFVFEATSNEEKQEDWGNRFASAITNDLDDLDGPVDVLYIADGTLFDKFMDIIARDALLAMIAFFYVYLYLQIHTGSFMLASLGMLQVIMPFPMGYFIYKVIFQVHNFYGLSSLTLFIVLAIGADDIFVFMDAWVQANMQPRHDTCTYMNGRFAHAWFNSGKAMGITSLTTMCAFLATMSSPLLEVKYFGTFAATLVALDYMLVMTFFACSVVVYHRYAEGTLGCLCCGGMGCGAWFNCCTIYLRLVEDEPEDEEARIPGCMESKLSQPRTCETLEEAREKLGNRLDFTVADHIDPEAVCEPEEAEERAEAETALLSDDVPYKRRRMLGFVVLGISVGVLLVGFILLSQDRSTDKQAFSFYLMITLVGLILFCAGMNGFRSARDRMKQLGLHKSQEDVFSTHIAPFVSGTRGPGKNPFIRLAPACVLCLVWGFMVYQASGLEKTTKTEQYLPDWHPIQRFIDSIFTDFPQSDQEFAHNVVVTIGVEADDPVDRSDWSQWDKDAQGKARIYESDTKQQDYTSESFQTFVRTLCSEVLRESLAGKHLQRTDVFDPPELDQNCFMEGFARHLANEGKTFPVPQSTYVSELWNFTEAQRSNSSLPAAFIYYDKILFKFDNPEQAPVGVEAMTLQFNTTLKERGNSNGDIREWFDDWEDFVDDIETLTLQWVHDIYGAQGYPLENQVMHSSEIFIWMHTQDVLVKGAINGTAISLGLAVVVVFLGSLNGLIAVLVLLELFGVVGYVLGVIKLIGWEMGTVESVSVTILVGLSVDYVVHFAMHYKEVNVEKEDDSGLTERQKRVFQTALEMGPTVLGGAATSIGAALVLLLTWIQFFYKFGICFLFTILFSYIWAMLFFLPLMSLVGPQNEFMSVRPLLAKCLPYFATPEEKMALKKAKEEEEMREPAAEGGNDEKSI